MSEFRLSDKKEKKSCRECVICHDPAKDKGPKLGLINDVTESPAAFIKRKKCASK